MVEIQRKKFWRGAVAKAGLQEPEAEGKVNASTAGICGTGNLNQIKKQDRDEVVDV